MYVNKEIEFKTFITKEQYENLIKTIKQRIDSLKKTSNSGSEAAKLENSVQLQTAQIELKEAGALPIG